MRITDSALHLILETMKKKGLDPNKVKLALAAERETLKLGFTRDRGGRKLQFGELTVLLGPGVHDETLAIDVGENDGRRGLLFLEKTN